MSWPSWTAVALCSGLQASVRAQWSAAWRSSSQGGHKGLIDRLHININFMQLSDEADSRVLVFMLPSWAIFDPFFRENGRPGPLERVLRHATPF